MKNAAVYVCDPGRPRGLTEKEAAALCSCRHRRDDHWMGGGECGECSRCRYYRPRKS